MQNYVKMQKDCAETAKEEIMECHNHFNENIEDLPASEFPNGDNYKFWVKVRDACLSAAGTKKEIVKAVVIKAIQMRSKF